MINHMSPDSGDDILNDLAPDLTPMLDILFILLVFLILTAGAVFQSLELTLPASAAEEIELVNKPKHILLEIRQVGYAIDGEELENFNTFKRNIVGLIRAKPTHELIVAGDKTIPIERLLKVLTYLQSQGIQTANILMQEETP